MSIIKYFCIFISSEIQTSGSSDGLVPAITNYGNAIGIFSVFSAHIKYFPYLSVCLYVPGPFSPAQSHQCQLPSPSRVTQVTPPSAPTTQNVHPPPASPKTYNKVDNPRYQPYTDPPSLHSAASRLSIWPDRRLRVAARRERRWLLRTFPSRISCSYDECRAECRIFGRRWGRKCFACRRRIGGLG